MDVDFIRVSKIVEDFESLIDFAGYCGLEKNFFVAEPLKLVLSRSGSIWNTPQD